MQIGTAAVLKPPMSAVLIWFGFWLSLGVVGVWSVRNWRRKRRLAGERERENAGKL